MRRSLARLAIPLREPFATAGGVVAERELLLLRLADDGVTGYGEAAPLQPYDGVPLAVVARALAADAAEEGPPQARTAEEMARLDLAARRAGKPLGEPGAEAIVVNRTLPAGPPDEVAARALLALWLPPLALMAVIFFLSAQPDLSSGLGLVDLIGRKFLHAGEYPLLCVLW